MTLAFAELKGPVKDRLRSYGLRIGAPGPAGLVVGVGKPFAW